MLPGAAAEHGDGFARELRRVITLRENGDLAAERHCRSRSPGCRRGLRGRSRRPRAMPLGTPTRRSTTSGPMVVRRSRSAPMLHAGVRLPLASSAGRTILEGGLMPAEGYLTL